MQHHQRDDVEHTLDYMEDPDGISLAGTSMYRSSGFQKYQKELEEKSPINDTRKGKRMTNTEEDTHPLDFNSSPTLARKFAFTTFYKSTQLSEWLSENSFAIIATTFWLICGIPGNLMVFYLSSADGNGEKEVQKTFVNTSNLPCHELKEDWKSLVDLSQFVIQGIGVMSIGIVGLIANLLSILVLVHCQKNKIFHRLLIGLAIIDSLLILDLCIGNSLFGTLMAKEPYFYKLAYPFLIHPGRGLVRTSAILMVVAVSTERYRGLCHPLSKRQSCSKYVLVVIFISATMEFPRFFEMRLTENRRYYVTTQLMENPTYLRFNSYWNELFATGILPLLLLIYMNLRIYHKIKNSTKFVIRFVSDRAKKCPEAEALNKEQDKADSIQVKSKTGIQKLKKKEERSASILLSIIVMFIVCHVHRLVFRVYEMAYPETSVFQHFKRCNHEGRFHVPVAIYFFMHTHYLSLAINSSANFIIYCAMGAQFRRELQKLCSRVRRFLCCE